MVEERECRDLVVAVRGGERGLATASPSLHRSLSRGYAQFFFGHYAQTYIDASSIGVHGWMHPKTCGCKYPPASSGWRRLCEHDPEVCGSIQTR